MNKQELIDKAVVEAKGKWPSSSNLCSYLYEFLNANNWKCGSSSLDAICTREEFEQRAKDLGYINCHQWGVEYQTNGVKPDLPDDVTIQVNGHNKGQWLGGRAVGVTIWPLVSKFKITDERYKPIKADAEKGWYDYDLQKAVALPPVGEVVEWMPTKPCKANWKKCHVDYVHDLNVCVTNFDSFKQKQVLCCVLFRPLDWNRKAEQERNELFKQAEQIALLAVENDLGYKIYSDRGLSVVINALADAGWRPTR